MLGVIVNPNALGVRRRPGLRDRLRAVIERLGDGRGVIVETHSTDELGAVAHDFAARGVDVVATCGGDGTNLHAVTELERAYGAARMPVLAILRGGTVNTIAENVGVRGASEAILRRLVDRLSAGAPLETRAQDTIAVVRDGAPAMFGFLFAAAMGARFLEAYYGGPVPGVPWAIALTLRTIGSCFVQGAYARWLFGPVPMELTVDGERVAEPAAPRLLVASTVPDVGLGMRVAWQAGREPGRFNLIASSLSTVEMATQLHKVRMGRPLSGAPHLDRLARAATIRFPAPETFTLDGELFSARDVSLDAGPTIRVVAP